MSTDFELDANDVNGPTLADDFVELAKLRGEDLRLKQAAEEAHSAYLKKRSEVYERMEDENVAAHKMPGVGHFIRNEPTWRPAWQDKAAFRAWAKENNPAFVIESEAKALVNQLVQERMRDGQELPPGLGAYPERVVSIRKA